MLAAGVVNVVAHRGDVENAPENTLPAFESAIALGADAIELDVHQTADGHLIVHHFYNLGSTDNGQGLVHEKTLAECIALDSGSWFNPQYSNLKKPTLSEVFALCKGRIRFEIDLKGSSLEFLQQVIAEIFRFGVEQDVEITSAHTPLLPFVKQCCEKLQTGTFFYEPPIWMPVQLAQQHVLDWACLLKIDVVHLNASLITQDFVHRLQFLGFKAYGSNLDTEEEIQMALTLGLDSFSTGHLKTALQLRANFSG